MKEAEPSSWVVRIGVVLLLGILCFFLRSLFDRLAKKRMIEPTMLEFLRKAFSVAVFFVFGLIVLDLIGLDVAPLLAFGGIGAAALGFASKDVISNFYGGLTIYLTRPFLTGDLITMPQRGIEGTIERIGWYFTTLRDLSKKPVYIPNAFFATELLVNQSRMTHRQINERLPLRYSDASKIEPLVEEIRHLFSTHPDIDSKQGIRVFVHSFAASSVVLEIKAYTLKTRYEDFMEVQQKILIRICEKVEAVGAGIGYPVSEQISRPVSI